MSRVFKILLIVLLMASLGTASWGAISLSLSPAAGTLERNSANGIYNVSIRIRPSTTTEVEALGDFYLTYDSAVFEIINNNFH